MQLFCNTDSIYLPEEYLGWDDFPVLPSKKIVKAQRRIFTKFIFSTTVKCVQMFCHNESFLGPKRELKPGFVVFHNYHISTYKTRVQK